MRSRDLIDGFDYNEHMQRQMFCFGSSDDSGDSDSSYSGGLDFDEEFSGDYGPSTSPSVGGGGGGGSDGGSSYSDFYENCRRSANHLNAYISSRNCQALCNWSRTDGNPFSYCRNNCSFWRSFCLASMGYSCRSKHCRNFLSIIYLDSSTCNFNSNA